MTAQITTTQQKTLANYVPNTFLFEVKQDILAAKVLKLFCQALNFKGISKTEEMLNAMVKMFSEKLQKDYSHITFEQIENALIKADFEYGENEHFNISPDLFVKILKEAGLYSRNLEIRNELIRQREREQLREEEQAREKYYKEHEAEILSKYINNSFKHWQNTNEICYLNYCYKYLNTFKKAFTDNDKEIAKERLTQRTQQHEKDRLAHIQKVREQAAAVYKELGISEKDTPQPYNYTDETTIGKLINKYTETTPTNQRKVKELNLTNLNNYQPTEQEIEKELVLMEFEKVAERLKKKQAKNDHENIENQYNKNQTNEINNNEPKNDKTNENENK